MSDVYTFTTTTNDEYWNRVVAEAPKETNIIVIKETTTVDKEVSLFLIIRDTYINQLAEKYPNEVLADMSLGDWLMYNLAHPDESQTGFSYSGAYNLSPDDAERELVTLRNQLARLKNLALDRVVRVEVTTSA